MTTTNTLGVSERARGILRRRRADAESLGGASEIDVAEIDEVLAALQGSDNVSEAMIDAAEAAYDLVPEGFCAHRKGLAKAYLAMSALRAPSNTVDAGGEDADWLRVLNMTYGFPASTATRLERIASRLVNTGGLVEALEKARPIIESEMHVIIDSYTNLSGPDKGEVTDKDALAEISVMDDALASINAALASVSSSGVAK